MQAGLLDVIFSAASHVQSFQDLTSGRDKRKQQHYEDMQEIALGDENERQVELDTKSMRMADESILVSDLLTELSRPLFEKIQELFLLS